MNNQEKKFFRPSQGEVQKEIDAGIEECGFLMKKTAKYNKFFLFKISKKSRLILDFFVKMC